MNERTGGACPLESVLAQILRYGTRIATTCIVFGLCLAFARLPELSTNLVLVKVGIVMFILLPSFRVAAMLVAFLRERDYPFGGLAALVLIIIACGLVVSQTIVSHS